MANDYGTQEKEILGYGTSGQVATPKSQNSYLRHLKIHIFKSWGESG